MKERARRRGRLVRPWLALLGLILALGILEWGARGIERLQAKGDGDAVTGEPVRVDDPELEYRVTPGTGGHDARGYRNREALERAGIVALGDSQTWGVNASVDASWPAELARQSVQSVYNMGHGGYGPLHYVVQVEEALSLSPRWIVVGLYLGNDLFDAYNLAYQFDAHAEWRHPDLEVRERIARSPYPDLQRMFFQRVNYRRPGFAPLAWLRENSRVVQLAQRGGLVPPEFVADRIWAEDHPGEGFVYRANGLETVFHTTYRLAAVDTRLERIAEGFRITEVALVALQQRVAAAPGVELLVVLLPTKERVFAEAVRLAGIEAPTSYDESVRFEAAVASDLVVGMAAHGIGHVDTLGELEAGVLRGEVLFPPNGDGHFTREGYAVVARVVAARIAARSVQR